MKKNERIVVSIFVTTFLALLFPFSYKLFFLFCGIAVLSVFYIVQGIKKFKQKEEGATITLLAAIAFTTSLLLLPLCIHLSRLVVIKLLPILNIGLFLYLLVAMLRIKKTPNKATLYKGLFIRSAAIMVLVGFFAYSPIGFKLYRNVLVALNSGDENIIANLEMFNYEELFEQALDENNCTNAIDYAVLSNTYGKQWLISHIGVDTLTKSGLKEFYNNVDKIQGTYSNLYEAYDCMADALYSTTKEKALLYYIKADNALDISLSARELDTYWHMEKSFSLRNMALCYSYMQDYNMADSLFSASYKKYMQVKDTADTNIAVIFEDIADTYKKRTLFDDSNHFYLEALNIIEKDTTDNNKTYLVKDYINISKNYLRMDSIAKGEHYIKKALALVDTKTLNYGIANLYCGIILFLKGNYVEAESVLNTSLTDVKKKLGGNHQNVAEVLSVLGQTEAMLAKYSLAREHLETGMQITIAKYGANSVKHGHFLTKLAFIDKEEGNYNQALEQYNKVEAIYKNHINNSGEDTDMVTLLSDKAMLQAELADLGNALDNADKAVDMAMVTAGIKSVKAAPFKSNCAYVYYVTGNYSIADTLYQSILTLNKQADMEQTVATAIAENGLGLIATAKGNYKKADSLFTNALAIQKNSMGEKHPNTALIYLNFGLLKIAQGNLTDALQLLQKSESINHEFFRDTHTVFADIYVGYGDIAVKQKAYNQAKDYYKKALAIYKTEFKNSHYSITGTLKKLNRLN